VYNGSVLNGVNTYPVITINGTGGTGPYHLNLRICNNVAYLTSNRSDYFIRFKASGDQVSNTMLLNNLVESAVTTWTRVEDTYYNFSDWQLNFSKDADSLKTIAGFVTPPTAIAHSPGFPNSQAACISEAEDYIAALHLATGSSAIDAGYIDVPVYTDYSGTDRPLSSKDIGAFEKI
jgi:hypothetical protein